MCQSLKCLFVVGFIVAGMCFGPIVETAEACPMCQLATEADDNLPRAYMVSILFMLAFPAAIFTGFSVGLYKLSKKEDAALIEAGLDHGFGHCAKPRMSS